MQKIIAETPAEMGRMAAEAAADHIRRAIENNGQANIILATGASQFEMLASLVKAPGIDWSKVVMFHLDEYIGLPITHPASFRKYLKERFVDQVPELKAVHFVDGEADNPAEECRRLGALIAEHPIDAAMIGIGENGHIAFNDPPADFLTNEPYIVVDLDEECRLQQVGEGWYDSLEEVPAQAISMSVMQIMKSTHIVCTVPDERKAKAVLDAVEGPMTNLCPASILRQHASCTLFLDEAAASLLSKDKR